MGEFDGEIGRGRQRGSGDDSSSSRESSKERPVPSHRIASPAHTEDGDSRMETTADDNSPPPPSQPLIRQALGFSSDKPPANINTYEAVPETVPKQAFFLPGQLVTQPKPDKPKKPRVKRTDAYPGQQSRFRIQTYDPTPTADPPIDHGSGPYSSMYRGVSGPPKNSGRDDSSAATAKGDPPNRSTPSSTNSNPARTKSAESRSSAASRSQPPPPAAPSRNRMQNAKAKSSQPDYQQSNQRSSAYPQHQPPLPPPPSHYPISASHSSTPSYHGSSSLPPSASPPYHRHDYSNYPREPRDREYHPPYGGPTSSYDAPPQSEEAQKRSKYPLRMVTVLIQDLRSGTIDHQLAEVKVPLRQCDAPEDGFWADSKDIALQIQHGPSRIDGPARAYTLRGKYRQFILRVTADNQDEFMSANVGIQQDRTLDLVIEMLPPPGGPPLAPKIPTELLGPSYEDSRSHSMDIDSRSPPLGKDARKRPTSPSFDDYDGQRIGPQSHSGPNKTPRHSYSQQYSPRRSPRHASPHYSGHPSNNDSRLPTRRQSVPMETAASQPQYTFPMPPIRQTPPSASPPDVPMLTLRPVTSDDDSMSPEPDGEFIAAVDHLLQEDSSAWTSFYKAKAGNKVVDVLKQYEFVRQKCKSLRGKPIPGFRQLITDDHIIQALKVEEKNYLQMCNRTMELMSLYGKQGRYYEDPRIEDMINDSSPPKYGSNPYKRILHLLEDIDKAWHNGKTETRPRPPQPHSPPLPSQVPSSHYDSDPMPQRSRTTKAFFTQ